MRARAAIAPSPQAEILRRIEVEDWVAIECDGRPFATALEAEIGKPVGRWPTGDALGADAVAFGDEAQLERVRAHAPDALLITEDGGVARVLERAGLRWSWLHQILGWDGQASCVSGGRTCCGAAAPLRELHPRDAEALRKRYVASDTLCDGRCAAWTGEPSVRDRLLEKLG